jgi:hypothetical protein
VKRTRRVSLSSEVDAPNRAEGPALDILLEALGDAAPALEEFHPEVSASGTASPPRALPATAAQAPASAGVLPTFRSGDENTKTENEP